VPTASRYLCISVTFLDPLFHGQGDEVPEWPPSPMRLAQALVAGARTGYPGRAWSDARAHALGLLSERPPLIVGPEARRATRCTYFVPNNQSDVVLDRQERLTSKVAWPHRLLSGETVHYVWAIEPGEEEAARCLCDMAKCILCLGWGIDQVAASGRVLSEVEVGALPGRRWQPWRLQRTGSQGWRVPSGDFVGDLDGCYRSFLKRVDGQSYCPDRKPTSFDVVHYVSSTALPPRAYAAFELPEGVAFRAENVAAVAAMLRSLACRLAREDEGAHAFPGGAEVYVAGHVEQGTDETPPRFSYLPLPSIGHEHADGMIRRLLIAEPFGGEGVHAMWAQQRLRNGTLQDDRGNERGVLLDLWRHSSRRVVELYVRESQCWYSVTPVIIPGFDDGEQMKAERLFLKAVAQAGIPIAAVDWVALRKAPFWAGGAHPRQYFVPEYMRHFSRWHVAIRFREPIPGPLSIGVGRHVGLGLFAAPEEGTAFNTPVRGQ
jgi:CRISPR-associated protein Csb2